MKPPRISTRIVGATAGAVHPGRASGRRHTGFPQADRGAQVFHWVRFDKASYVVTAPLIAHARLLPRREGLSRRTYHSVAMSCAQIAIIPRNSASDASAAASSTT